ncbi:MAG: hypothetical protein QXZ70_00535 [Candidatus Bathyarchaeia archaeon]
MEFSEPYITHGVGGEIILVNPTPYLLSPPLLGVIAIISSMGELVKDLTKNFS